MNNKILAAGSVALMGAGSFLAATPAQAYTEADCGTEPTGAFLSLINDDICSLTFNTSSDADWSVPAGIDRLAAVLVGGGGGSVSFVGGGYAGGGGEVIYVSDVDPEDIADMVIGDGGNFIDDNGSGHDTTLGLNTARGGEYGEYDTSLGESGNGNAGAPVNNDLDIGLYGGGAKTAATTSGPGEGYVLSDSELTDDDELFPVIVGASTWGKGGNVGEIPETTGYGEGASATDSDSTVGTQGAIVFRWSLSDVNTDSETPLASTGVDANAIGMTAGALGLGGVALAVVSAARRTRRTK